GAPLASVTVTISDAFSTVSTVTTNAAGDYKSAALPPGTYFAKTAFNSGGYINQLYLSIPCASCTASLGTAIVIPTGAGSTTPITGKNFALARGGSIEGTVLRSNGAGGFLPVPTANVSIYTTGGAFVAGGAAAANGSYAVRGLPTDQYFAVTSNS